MSKREIVDAAYAELLQAYQVLKERKPLAIGVHDQFLILVDDPAVAKAILSKHTNTGRYLKALSAGGQRYHLDGTEAGEITAEQQALALQRLLAHNAKKEQKEAAKKARKAAEREKQIATGRAAKELGEARQPVKAATTPAPASTPGRPKITLKKTSYRRLLAWRRRRSRRLAPGMRLGWARRNRLNKKSPLHLLAAG